MRATREPAVRIRIGGSRRASAAAPGGFGNFGIQRRLFEAARECNNFLDRSAAQQPLAGTDRCRLILEFEVRVWRKEPFCDIERTQLGRQLRQDLREPGDDLPTLELKSGQSLLAI